MSGPSVKHRRIKAPTAAYWGRVLGGGALGTAAFLATRRLVPSTKSPILRYGAGLLGGEIGSTFGDYGGLKAGTAVDRKILHHRPVDEPHESAKRGLARIGAEALGGTAGLLAGERVAGPIGAVVGSTLAGAASNALSPRVERMFRRYEPKTAARLRRSITG